MFNLKYNANCTLERFKARVVAKGYTQTYGIDYVETFASVAKMTLLQILLSSAACFGWGCNNFVYKMHSFMVNRGGFRGATTKVNEAIIDMVCKINKALRSNHLLRHGLTGSPKP